MAGTAIPIGQGSGRDSGRSVLAFSLKSEKVSEEGGYRLSAKLALWATLALVAK